jgi:hypothetical protein
MLPLEAALPLVRDLRAYIERDLLGRGVRPDENIQVLIADAVAGLEYYLEAVDHDRVGMTHLLESARRAIEALQSGDEPETYSDDEQVVIESSAPEPGEAEEQPEVAGTGLEADAAGAASQAPGEAASAPEPGEVLPEGAGEADLGDLESVDSEPVGATADEGELAAATRDDPEALDSDDVGLTAGDSEPVQASAGEGEVAAATGDEIDELNASALDAGDLEWSTGAEELEGGGEVLDAGDLDTGHAQVSPDDSVAHVPESGTTDDAFEVGELDDGELESGLDELPPASAESGDTATEDEPDVGDLELAADEAAAPAQPASEGEAAGSSAEEFDLSELELVDSTTSGADDSPGDAGHGTCFFRRGRAGAGNRARPGFQRGCRRRCGADGRRRR